MVSNQTVVHPFISLSKIASEHKWCAKVVCTTCGHSAFRVAFAKLVAGLHPNDNSFWPNGKKAPEFCKEINDFPQFKRPRTLLNFQTKLAEIVATTDLFELKNTVELTDWLLHIGLVIHHCPYEKASKILSDSFLPQFLKMTEESPSIHHHFSQQIWNQEQITLADLEKVETCLNAHQ